MLRRGAFALRVRAVARLSGHEGSSSGRAAGQEAIPRAVVGQNVGVCAVVGQVALDRAAVAATVEGLGATVVPAEVATVEGPGAAVGPEQVAQRVGPLEVVQPTGPVKVARAAAPVARRPRVPALLQGPAPQEGPTTRCASNLPA